MKSVGPWVVVVLLTSMSLASIQERGSDSRII